VLDVEATSADEALVLAHVFADETTVVYRTTDAGTSWTEAFVSATFVNCIAMFDRRHGFAMGDPVDGKFQIIVTSDRGRSWDLVPSTGMPDALEGEVGVGFGGECAAATGRKAFFGTAAYTPSDPRLPAWGGTLPNNEFTGAETGRVFRSSDFGLTWEVAPTPVRCCIWGMDFRTNRLGLAIGGDFLSDPVLTDRLARTTDGGVTWVALNDPLLEINHVNLAWWSDRRGDERSVPDAQRTVFATGETSLVSRNRGKTWELFDDGPMYSIDCVKRDLSCWGAGPDGRIAKLVVD
jgi:hypothetical protein